MSDQRFSMLREITHHYYTFFTRKGLSAFMEDGIICDIPRQLIYPCTRDERIDLLTQLRDGISDGSVLGRLTNDQLLSLPENLSFCISEYQQIDIFTLQGSDTGESFYNIHIQEALLGNAFMDFVLWLPQSEYLEGKNETVAFLDQLLAEG